MRVHACVCLLLVVGSYGEARGHHPTPSLLGDDTTTGLQQNNLRMRLSTVAYTEGSKENQFWTLDFMPQFTLGKKIALRFRLPLHRVDTPSQDGTLGLGDLGGTIMKGLEWREFDLSLGMGLAVPTGSASSGHGKGVPSANIFAEGSRRFTDSWSANLMIGTSSDLWKRESNEDMSFIEQESDMEARSEMAVKWQLDSDDSIGEAACP